MAWSDDEHAAAEPLIEEEGKDDGYGAAVEQGRARFHNMMLYFKHTKMPTGLTNPQQAREILRIVDELHQAGAQKVGLTYSANTGQTAKIRQNYKDGVWLTNTSGADQAAVVKHIETLLRTSAYKHLQQVFRILPISTIHYAGGGGASVPEVAVVEADMTAIEKFIAAPNTHVLGWQNQNTPTEQYGVGGGVTKQQGLDTSAIDAVIQDRLIALSKKYPGSGYECTKAPGGDLYAGSAPAQMAHRRRRNRSSCCCWPFSLCC